MSQKTQKSRGTAVSIFERLGGAAAIRGAVDQLYVRIVDDAILRPFFEGADLKHLKEQQCAFFSQLLGGPGRYSGRSMRDVHASMKIEPRHFERMAKHLAATFKAMNVPDSVAQEVLSAVAPLAEDIVTVETAGDALAADNLETLMFEQMVENSPINIMRADSDLVIRYQNSASRNTLSKLEHLLPCKASQVVGKSVDIFHKDAAHQRRLLSDPKNLPHHADIRLGEETLSLLVSPLYDHSKNYLGPMVTWEVVTEKLRLERMNNDYAGQIAAIHASQVVLECAMDGTILNMNDNFLNLFHYTREELAGKNARIFSDKSAEQSAAFRETWAKLNRGEYSSGEGKRITKDGQEIWIQFLYNPIKGADGKPYKVVNHFTDITEQKTLAADFAGQIAAIGKSQAIIEFHMDGTVISANDNFLKTLGYALDEIKGKHHSMFVDEGYRQSAAYKEFWAKLNRGEYVADEFKRIGKGGKEVWIQASYNPILDLDGKPFKVVKYATDVTAQKLQNADYSGQIAAIGKAQAVIEFQMDGTIVTANENFLKTLGYALDEIKGKHHSMFVDEGYRQSAAYKEFWARLNRGEYVADEFKRIGKGGKEVWIQASYNPIMDLNGKPFKVVKYAIDVTKQKLQNADYTGQIAAIGKAQAVIEFQMDGTIITANENFLKTLGYTWDEVKGKQHSVFVDEDYKRSASYKEFWAKLNRGEYIADEFKRIGKGGTEVWIQGSYNPILDLNGKPFKVVKYATDITARMKVTEEVTNIAGSLATAAEQLTTVSQQMSANAEETSAQANTVATATQQVSENLHSVATGAEEMTATVQSIASNASEAAKVAGEAVKTAHGANATVAKLGESSAEIGQVIKVITSIAQQTNLLALNATIEAARAGEAGKGFAVVANEVKELAKQTAKATEDISQKITAIQEDTKRAVESIGSITGVINQINDISGTIATAVEEQSATTNEMSRNVTEAAKGSGDISQNVQGMAEAAESTARGAQDTQKSAQKLSELAAKLQTTVGQTSEAAKESKAPAKGRAAHASAS
jgi:methyl-accepting chemotaxis protein